MKQVIDESQSFSLSRHTQSFVGRSEAAAVKKKKVNLSLSPGELLLYFLPRFSFFCCRLRRHVWWRQVNFAVQRVSEREEKGNKAVESPPPPPSPLLTRFFNLQQLQQKNYRRRQCDRHRHRLGDREGWLRRRGRAKGSLPIGPSSRETLFFFLLLLLPLSPVDDFVGLSALFSSPPSPPPPCCPSPKPLFARSCS